LLKELLPTDSQKNHKRIREDQCQKIFKGFLCDLCAFARNDFLWLIFFGAVPDN